MNHVDPRTGFDKTRYGELEKKHPQHPQEKGHERSWTAAKGVWYCYTCEQHYRVYGPRGSYETG